MSLATRSMLFMTMVWRSFHWLCSFGSLVLRIFWNEASAGSFAASCLMRSISSASQFRYRVASFFEPYPVVAGRMVHPTSREIRARAVEQDPSYKHPRARGV